MPRRRGRAQRHIYAHPTRIRSSDVTHLPSLSLTPRTSSTLHAQIDRGRPVPNPAPLSPPAARGRGLADRLAGTRCFSERSGNPRPKGAGPAMQEVLLRPAHPVGFGLGPSPLGFADRRLCSPGLLLPNGGALFYGGYTTGPRVSPRGDGPFYGGYTPCTPSPRPSPRGGYHLFTPSPGASPLGAASLSAPSSSGSRLDDAHAATSTEHRLRMARLALQYQDAANRYELCVSQLADTAREAAALRLENAELRVANNDLNGRFLMLGGNRGSAIALAGQLHRLHLGQMQPMPLPGARPVLLPTARPASPAEKHAVLPKSISIRSPGYLTMPRNGGNGKHRVTGPVNVGSQRVFVGVDGTKPEEQKGRDREKAQLVTSTGGMEFEVYNQGMFKTELCNKWDETGTCPYADQCQFAHGIAELRPIIRHPRYKTQVCRMIIGGGLCPYGHRCHFRHSITPADHPLLLGA